MNECLEAFAIEDAFHEFICADLCNASLALLQAMDYPVQSHSDMGNQNIESFIYLTVQNKYHYNAQEMKYLKQIETASFICKLQYRDLIDENENSDETIVFLAIEINSSVKDRSEDSFYISQILNKTYDGYVILIIKNANHIMFCSSTDDQAVFMSEWYSLNSTCIELFPLCDVCYPYIIGVRTVKDYYYEMVYKFSRDYIRYPESYEFIAYQCMPIIDYDFVDSLPPHQQIKDIVEQNQDYFRKKYGYDYVTLDINFDVLLEEDEEWTLLELDDFVSIDKDLEDIDAIDYDDENAFERIDYSDVTNEVLNDPVRLLKWLEKRDSDRKL